MGGNDVVLERSLTPRRRFHCFTHNYGLLLSIVSALSYNVDEGSNANIFFRASGRFIHHPVLFHSSSSVVTLLMTHHKLQRVAHPARHVKVTIAVFCHEFRSSDRQPPPLIPITKKQHTAILDQTTLFIRHHLHAAKQHHLWIFRGCGKIVGTVVTVAKPPLSCAGLALLVKWLCDDLYG